MPDRKPPAFDVAIIGAGPAGMAAAHRARECGLSVVQFEARDVGGTSVNRGCVAKRLFVTASRQGDVIRLAEPFGWSVPGEAVFDWPGLRDVVRDRVRAVREQRSERLRADGVTLVPRRVQLAGDGRIVATDADTDGDAGTAREWHATDIVIATGSRPLVPDLPGAELALLSDDLFTLDTLPGRIAMVGGGYIAVEFAGALRRFGVEVSVFESRERLLEGFDAQVVSHLEASMREAGIDIVCGTRAKAIEKSGSGLKLVLDGERDRDGFDAVALVIGRAPNVEGIGLERAGVTLTDAGLVQVDGQGRTSAAHVHAVGDIVESLQLAPVAAEGGRAVIDAILGRRVERTCEEHVPTAVYSEPECGSIGLSEMDAEARGIAHEVRRARYHPLDGVFATEPDRVLTKLVVEKPTGRLLGFHAFGPHAVECTQLMALPITVGLSEHDLQRTMPLHPAHAEEIVSLGRGGAPTNGDGASGG